jgi:Fur family ferric uptake transcriptional regulator
MEAARARDHDQLMERLTRSGLRPTRGRVAVLEELSREADDATAQALHGRLRRRGKRVGLATVYRALHDLSGADVIDALPHGPGETCYRLCGEGHHHHLVCSSCHRIVELTGCRVGPWVRRAAEEKGFEPTEHHLEIVGLCGACRA